MKDDIDSLEMIVCESVHNAQVAYLKFSNIAGCYDNHNANDWIYDVEAIELAAQRILDISNGRCSLSTSLRTDIDKDTQKIKLNSDNYCLKILELIDVYDKQIGV